MSRSRTIRFAVPSGVLIAVLVLVGIPAVHAQTTAPTDPTPAAVRTEAASKTEPSQGEMAQKQIAEAVQSIKLSYAFQLYLQARDTGSGQYGTESTTDIFFKRNRLMLSGQASDIVGFY